MMDRKEEIIFATLELASENGLKSVSMSQIAEKVGIKAPSLYNHFKSKDEIVKTMYSYLRESARKGRPSGFTVLEEIDSKTLEQILNEALSAYLGMISDRTISKYSVRKASQRFLVSRSSKNRCSA